MYTGMTHLHSSLRYLLLFFLVVTIVNAIVKLNKPHTKRDDGLSLITFVLTHIQLLLGLGLYFMGPRGASLFARGMADVMSNEFNRFFAVEHLTGMLIAIVLITVGRIRMKKKTEDKAKHKTTLVFYLLAFIVMFLSIPWPFRVPGYGWF